MDIPNDLKAFIETFKPKHFQIGASFIDFFNLEEYPFFQNQYSKKAGIIERIFLRNKTKPERYFFGQLPDSSPIYYEVGDVTGIYYEQHGSDYIEKLAGSPAKLVEILNYVKGLHDIDNQTVLSEIKKIDNSIDGDFWISLINDDLGKSIYI